MRAAGYLDAWWHAHRTPAVSVAVAHRGRLVFSRGVGYADLDNMVPATGSTVYNIGSVSKVQAAIAVLQLVEKGRVRLEDSIRTYAPEYPDKGVTITLQHILTHTSGIRHYRAGDFPESADMENVKIVKSYVDGIPIFGKDPLLFPPGKSWSYSSYAVNLLQGVVEKAGGVPFEEYMRRFVWGPAGMTASQFDVPARIVPGRARGYRTEDGVVRNGEWGDIRYKFAGGGMLSTAEDLVRLGMALLHGRLLSDETKARMFRAQIDPVMRFEAAGKPPEKESFRQGLIVRLRTDAAGRNQIEHSGSVKGFGTNFILYPDQDLAVATLVNMNEELGRRDAEAIAGFFLETAAGD
jgi:CubicO group peptidase (beta-lactamase class C family)